MKNSPGCIKRQATCAGCGIAGETPTIVYDRSAPQPITLRPVFVADTVVMLLCDACRKAQARHDQRRDRHRDRGKLTPDQAALDLDDKGGRS